MKCRYCQAPLRKTSETREGSQWVTWSCKCGLRIEGVDAGADEVAAVMGVLR